MPFIVGLPQVKFVDADYLSFKVGKTVKKAYWTQGSEVTAPAAGTALVTHTVSANSAGYIVALEIFQSEPNDYDVNWTSGAVVKNWRIYLPIAGYYIFSWFIPLNINDPADANSAITITNVNAGSAGSKYKASLLVVEV